MKELIEKVEKLNNTLDNLELIKEMKKINEETMKDKELLENIKRYQETQDDKIKEEILKNSTFQKYKDVETNLNILILEINHLLKEINDSTRSCL